MHSSLSSPRHHLLLLLLLCPAQAFAADTPESPSITQAWAAAVLRLDDSQLAPEILDKLSYTLADSVGILAYTSQLEECRRFAALQPDAAGNTPAAHELVTGRRVSTADAAAINAFAIHGHEIDDSNLRNQLRASCVAIPAALAAAETRDVSGQEFLTSLAIAFQIGDSLGTSLNRQPAGRLHASGWMPSAIGGTLAAAAATGKLFELSADDLASALALSAGGAGGLFQYYFDGSDEKRIHVARAQRVGVESAFLAQAGFRGALLAIEGPAGLVRALGQGPRREELLAGIDRWDAVLHVKPKFFACSQGVIPWLEVLAPLHAGPHPAADQIEQITLFLNRPEGDFYIRKINQFQPPANLLEAQLNVNFGIGLFWNEGQAFIDQYVESMLDDPAVLALARRVKAVNDPKQEGRIEIRDRQGRVLVGKYDRATLDQPYRPVEADYRRKFDQLTSRLAADQREALWRHARQVKAAPSMRTWVAELVEFLQVAPQPQPAGAASR
jgi:2-methylcitrate dehydratase PrpD